LVVIDRTRLALVVLLSIVSVAVASAQAPVGTRAEGMAGAFVAVADDASAVYWNPAGIATGSFVSAVVSFGSGTDADASSQISDPQEDSRAIVALSATAIGGAYYRFTAYGSAAVEPAVSGSSSREEVGRFVHAVTLNTVGVSLLQSLSDHIVVAATPKFVRAAGANAFDVDAGVMFSKDHVRLGLVAHNLTGPSFDAADGTTIDLDRDVRIGAAWGSGWTGLSRVIVSVDGDLMSRVTPAGDRRDVAAGVETWWLNQRLALRGGVRGSTIGDARTAVAAGISAGLTPGVLLEAHVVRGRADERSWSIGARMSF
jgi:hypothetical protein